MNTIIDYRLLGQRLKSQRKKKGFTQEKVADIMNYSPGYISQIERGATKVNLDTLAAICSIYDCDISEIVSGINRQHSGYLSYELSALIEQLTKKEYDLLYNLLNTYINTR